MPKLNVWLSYIEVLIWKLALETSANFVATSAGKRRWNPAPLSGAGFQRELPASVSWALNHTSAILAQTELQRRHHRDVWPASPLVDQQVKPKASLAHCSADPGTPTASLVGVMLAWRSSISPSLLTWCPHPERFFTWIHCWGTFHADSPAVSTHTALPHWLESPAGDDARLPWSECSNCLATVQGTERGHRQNLYGLLYITGFRNIREPPSAVWVHFL